MNRFFEEADHRTRRAERLGEVAQLIFVHDLPGANIDSAADDCIQYDTQAIPSPLLGIACVMA